MPAARADHDALGKDEGHVVIVPAARSHVVKRQLGRRLCKEADHAVLCAPGQQVIAGIIVLVHEAALLQRLKVSIDLRDGVRHPGGVVIEQLRERVAAELGLRLAGDVFEHGAVVGIDADGHGGRIDGVALLLQRLAVEVAVIIHGDACGAAVERADIRRGLVRDDIARGIAVDVHAARLTDETADVDLIVVRGVAGHAAERVAVDRRGAVVHAVQAAGIDVVGVRSGGDVDIRPAVGHGAAQHAGGQTARAGEALGRGHVHDAGDGAVVDIDAVLRAADQTAGEGLIAGGDVNGNVGKVDILERDHALICRQVVRGQLARRQAEEAGGHLVGGGVLAADGQAGDRVIAAVIIAAERVGGDGRLFAVDLAVECPADGQPLAAEGDVRRLEEVSAAPVDVRVDGLGQIAQLRLGRDAVRVGLRAGAAGELRRVGRVVGGEVAVGRLVLGLRERRVIGSAAALAGDDRRLGDLAVRDRDLHDRGLVGVAAVPDAVEELELRLRHFFTRGLHIGHGSCIRTGNDKLPVRVVGPRPERIHRQAIDRDIRREGREVGVERRGDGCVARRVITGHAVDKATGILVALVVDAGGDLCADGLDRLDELRGAGVLADEHGAVKVVPAEIGLADTGDPAGGHADIGGVFLGRGVARTVTVDDRSGIARHERADDGHALVAVFAAAAAVDIADGVAVGHEAAVVQADEPADLGEVTAQDRAGQNRKGGAVDDRALILHAHDTADKLVALRGRVGDGAGDRAAVHNGTREDVGLAAAVEIARDAADIGRGLITGVERNVPERDIAHDGRFLQHAEQADEEIVAIEGAGRRRRADRQAGDRVAPAVECTGKGPVAAADGRPRRIGNVDIRIERDILVRVVDLVVERTGKRAQLLRRADEIGAGLRAVAGGEDARIDLAADPDVAGRQDAAVVELPLAQCHAGDAVCRKDGVDLRNVAAERVGKCSCGHIRLCHDDRGHGHIHALECRREAAVDRGLDGLGLLERIAVVGLDLQHGVAGKVVADTERPLLGINRVAAAAVLGHAARGDLTGERADPGVLRAAVADRHITDGIGVVLLGRRHADDAAGLTAEVRALGGAGIGRAEGRTVGEHGIIACVARNATGIGRLRPAERLGAQRGVRPAVGDADADLAAADEAGRPDHAVLTGYVHRAGRRAAVDAHTDGVMAAAAAVFGCGVDRVTGQNTGAALNGVRGAGQINIRVRQVEIFHNGRIAERGKQADVDLTLDLRHLDLQAGDRVAAAVERAGKELVEAGVALGLRADGVPVGDAGEVNVRAERHIPARVGIAPVDCRRKRLQLRGAGDHIGIRLSAAAGNVRRRLRQRVVHSLENAVAAQGGAGNGVDAVRAVGSEDAVKELDRLRPVFRCLFVGDVFDPCDLSVRDRHGQRNIPVAAAARTGVRAVGARGIRLCRLSGQRQQGEHHGKAEQQAQQLRHGSGCSLLHVRSNTFPFM